MKDCRYRKIATAQAYYEIKTLALNQSMFLSHAVSQSCLVLIFLGPPDFLTAIHFVFAAVLEVPQR